MGLDMHAYATTEAIETDTDFAVDHDLTTPVHYWRKHPNLHGWMERLYRAKGGAASNFNLVPLRLVQADLDALETAIKNGELPTTTGFFFGESDGSELDDDLAFIAAARDALAKGMTVFYTSWW
jgi:hypothetical protein